MLRIMRCFRRSTPISKTNVAMDAALSKVADRWRGHPALERGEVQRLGRNYTDELKTDDVEPYVSPEKIVMRRSAHIQDKLYRIRQPRDEAERDARIWESIEALNHDIDAQRRLAADKTEMLSQLQQEADRLRAQWSKHRKALQRVSQRNRLTGISHNRLHKRREVYQQLYTRWLTITADIAKLTSERDERQAESTRPRRKRCGCFKPTMTSIRRWYRKRGGFALRLVLRPRDNSVRSLLGQRHIEINRNSWVVCRTVQTHGFHLMNGTTQKVLRR